MIDCEVPIFARDSLRRVHVCMWLTVRCLVDVYAVDGDVFLSQFQQFLLFLHVCMLNSHVVTMSPADDMIFCAQIGGEQNSHIGGPHARVHVPSDV